MRRPSGIWMSPRATMDAGGSFSSALPAKIMDTRESGSRPEIARFSVDFPAPFDPRMAMISPCPTVRSRPCRISVPPYPACTPLTIRIGSGIMGSGSALRRALTEVGLYDARICRDRLRRSLRDDAAFGQNQDLLRKAHHGLHHVLDQDDGGAALADGANERQDVGVPGRIDPGDHFVRKKKPRVDRERARQLEPLERRDGEAR